MNYQWQVKKCVSSNGLLFLSKFVDAVRNSLQKKRVKVLSRILTILLNDILFKAFVLVFTEYVHHTKYSKARLNSQENEQNSLLEQKNKWKHFFSIGPTGDRDLCFTRPSVFPRVSQLAQKFSAVSRCTTWASKVQVFVSLGNEYGLIHDKWYVSSNQKTYLGGVTINFFDTRSTESDICSVAYKCSQNWDTNKYKSGRASKLKDMFLKTLLTSNH